MPSNKAEILVRPLEEIQKGRRGRTKDFNSTWQMLRANEDLPANFGTIYLNLDEKSETEEFHGFRKETDYNYCFIK